MSDPIWVDERAVITANYAALRSFGPPADSIFDASRLAGALNRPQLAFNYGDPTPDIIELAAIYVHAICKAHAFVDGNKRTAFYACRIFLMRNGYAFDPPTDETVEFFVRVADDKHTGITERDVADWIRRHATRIP